MAVTAFLAATPLPMNSELVFLGLLAAGSVPVWVLVLVASVANTAGSFVTYGIGRGLDGLAKGRFALTEAQHAKAERWFARWGVWALLLAWAPGGDLVVAMAGALRTNIWIFGLLVGISKTLRYIALAGVVALF
jgi:membrane protein YqaA with SNARE-associated domain